MARYIEADALQRRICGAKCGCEYEDCGCEGDCAFDHFISHAPTADVAPRAEVERLERILNSYVLQYGTAVDKQKIIDEAKIEVAREIIGEILSTNTPDVDGFFTIHETELTELKKKYTEGQK